MIRKLALCSCLGLFVWGCPSTPTTPDEAFLEGTWTITPEDPGDFEDVAYEGTFNQDGQLVELKATRDDGATATLDASGSVTTVEGDQITVSVPTAGGARLFEGTVSEDQNTITGDLTDEINLGGLEIAVPAGTLTWERTAS